MTEQKARAINTTVVAGAFVLQIAFMIFSQGKMAQKIDDMQNQINTLEGRIDHLIWSEHRKGE